MPPPNHSLVHRGLGDADLKLLRDDVLATLWPGTNHVAWQAFSKATGWQNVLKALNYVLHLPAFVPLWSTYLKSRCIERLRKDTITTVVTALEKSGQRIGKGQQQQQSGPSRQKAAENSAMRTPPRSARTTESGASYSSVASPARTQQATAADKICTKRCEERREIYTNRIHSPVGLNREPSSPIFSDPTDPQDSS